MSKKSYFSLLALALTVLTAVAFVVGYNNRASDASTHAALAALPASDFVVSIDARRALNEILPSMLASNPAEMAKVNAKLDEFQLKTGINPRSFESIAIGGRISAARPHDSRTVVVVRGSFNSEELLETAFSTATTRGEQFQKEEQKYEGKKIFLVSSTRNMKADVEAGKTVAQVRAKREMDRMAIVALDANTLAIGNLESVRAAIDASLGRDRVDDELIRLATNTPNAVVGFSGRIAPTEVEKSSFANNPVAKYFSSIRQFYGSFSSDGSNAETSVSLRTETVEQATDISQALNTVKSLSSFGFSRSTGGDAAKVTSIADLLKGLTITTQGNEVQINLTIPHGSFAPFLRRF